MQVSLAQDEYEKYDGRNTRIIDDLLLASVE